MGANQNMQTVLAYRAARALEQQLDLQREQAGLAESRRRRRRRRIQAFFDRLLGIR